ncbi:MAG TPA: type IV secretory system conjugative DNA transfer family protein [Acidimicrobiales bacterium]
MEWQDRAKRWDLDERERRWRRQLDLMGRRARFQLDDSARRARGEIDRQVDEARRRMAADASQRQAPAPARRSPDWQDVDDRLLPWVLPAIGVAAVPLTVGHLAALLVHGGTPSYRLGEAPGILARLVADPADPGAAWRPVNTGAPVPGPVAWWGTFLVLVALVGVVALLVWSAVRRPAAAGSAGWAPPQEVRELWLGKKHDGTRLVLGTGGGRKLGVRDRHALLVVGPAHSGKSSGVTVPAIVEWDGPVVVAATKGHLIDETIGWRSRLGEVHVYDPAAVTRYPRSGWSLLAQCHTWKGAIHAAADLTLGARASVGASESGDGITAEGRGDLWRSSMAMSLAPFLLATVASGRSITTTAEWIEREERDEVLEILQGVDRDAARAHRMTFMRPDESRSRFLHAMQEILSVYEDPVVASSMDRHDIVTTELLDGGANTLYLTTPEHDQDRFRPLCAMIVRQMLVAAYESSARLGAPLDPPLLVVLDDVVGIAPIYDLAALASTSAARGVQVVSVFQDVGQIREHYGAAADLIVKNHAARLVLPGGAGAGRGDSGLGLGFEHDMRKGEAALLYGTGAPVRVRLRPWYADGELSRRVQTPVDDVKPADPDHSDTPLSVAEQSAVWLRRTMAGTSADASDPTIPLDTADPDFVAVFGSIDEDLPQNVTPLADDRRFRR